MYIRNNVPILAPITESIVALAMFVLVVSIWQRYLRRKRDATLYLSVAFTSYATSVLLTAIGKWLQFGLNIDPEVTSYADFFILLAYTFTALSNVYLFAFIDTIFLNKGIKAILPIAILNSISIGLFIPAISLKQGSYAATTPIVLYHALNTIFLMCILTYVSLRERKKSDEKLPKIGFLLIAFYGVFNLLLFLSFGIDLAIVYLTEKGYSPFYYLSWVFALLGLICGYLGYIMPDWFKKLIEH